MNGIAPGTPGHGPHGSCSAWSAGGSEPARSGAREAPRPGRAARRGRPRRAGLARARLAHAPRHRAAARGAAGAVVGAARLRRRVHDRGGARFLGAGAYARGGRGVRLLVGRAPEPAGRQSRRLGRVLGRAPAGARGTPRAAGRPPVGGAGSAGAAGAGRPAGAAAVDPHRAVQSAELRVRAHGASVAYLRRRHRDRRHPGDARVHLLRGRPAVGLARSGPSRICPPPHRRRVARAAQLRPDDRPEAGLYRPTVRPSDRPAVIGVVIPTLNEASYLPGLLADLQRLRQIVPLDVVVADGGSRDGTLAVAERAAARTLVGPAGRARQLNAGAAAARGEWLLFLHADARVPPAARRALLAAVVDAPVPQVAVFRFAIDLGHGRVHDGGEQGASRRGGHAGIGVEEQEPLAPRRSGARVELPRPASRTDEGAGSGAFRHGERPVPRAAVRHHDVQGDDLPEALQIGEQAGQVRGFVQRRNDDADHGATVGRSDGWTVKPSFRAIVGTKLSSTSNAPAMRRRTNTRWPASREPDSRASAKKVYTSVAGMTPIAVARSEEH